MTLQFRAGAHVVRAKVYVSDVTTRFLYRQPDGQGGIRDVHMEDVSFRFVSGNDPDSENKKFFDATPPRSAPMMMTIANPEAQALFRPGQELYLDFIEAVREESA